MEDDGTWLRPREAGEAVYFIQEVILPAPVSLPGIAGIGPGSKLVKREVKVLLDEYQTTFHGQPLGRHAGLREVLIELLLEGDQIGGQPTGNRRWYTAFIGEVGVFTAPLTHQDMAEMRSAYIGKDPIPKVRLYGNPKVTFHSSGGGRDNPYACAFYDGPNNHLKAINPDNKRAVLERIEQLGVF